MLRGAHRSRSAKVAIIGTASIARSTTATAEAIFWQATEASALPAHTTFLDTRSKGRPGNVPLARIKTGAPSRFLVTMPRDGAIILGQAVNQPVTIGES